MQKTAEKYYQFAAGQNLDFFWCELLAHFLLLGGKSRWRVFD
jgi:hypothetical protein